MITHHQYIYKYPIDAKSKKLILGTIHPHDHKSFLLPFFYGNKMSIWKILNKAFNNEMGDIITLESILLFLKNHKITISDTIKTCERINSTALDKDLRPLELNTQLIKKIRDSNIEEILFTSGFGKNNAFKLFYDNILSLKITPEIKKNREVVLVDERIGRPLKLTVLYSPSGASNVGISQSKLYKENAYKYEKSKTPVYDFKVAYYRCKFQN